MRILQVIAHPLPTRGAAAQAVALARGLRSRGHSVTCVLPHANSADAGGDPRLKALAGEGIAVERFTMNGGGQLRGFRRFLAGSDFDVVHAHYRDTALRRVLVASLGMPLPALVASWGNVYPIDRRRWLPAGYRERDLERTHSAWAGVALRARRLDRIVAVSEATKRVLVETGGVAASKIEVVYEGVDPDRFNPEVDGDAIRREFGVPARAPLVGIISANYWVKDLATFFAAAALLARERRDVRFLVAGEGTERVLDDLGADPDIRDRVVAAGRRHDVPELIASLDVLVSTSLYEALGGVLREALAMATAVVCTDVGGNSELVTPGETGVLVPPRDPASVATAVGEVLAQPEASGRMADRGRRRVLERHVTERRTEMIERIYREAIARRPAGGRPGRLSRA